MKQLTAALSSLFAVSFAMAQEPQHRLVLIGDAGKMNQQQQAVINAASGYILPGKTTVVYLGNNIYPHGMALPGSKGEDHSKAILQSQYAPMRSTGATVYFVPGNRDWNSAGGNGLAKIKAQSAYLAAQNDSLLQLLPADGCPDPIEINLGDSITLIAFDSEWWLYPYTKRTPGSDCNCRTKDDVTARLGELLYKNRYKVVLLAAHHPLKTYGHHGGYFGWKDNIFPLTALNKNLYLPLPVAGSLYPLVRKAFAGTQDLAHPLYRNLVKRIEETIAGYPNVIPVAGHEQGLELIKGAPLQVVSGSAAATDYIRKGRQALFAVQAAGFIIADILPGNHMRFTCYTKGSKGFESAYTYMQPYSNVKEREEEVVNSITTDSMVVIPHPSYDKVSKLHRAIFGENYRKEYAAAATVPVITISDVQGGLTPDRLGGGHQSKSLRLLDKEGKEWVLRSVEKYPDVLLPEELRETFLKDLLSDNMSSNHPYAALIVPDMATAAGVPHSHPVIGWVAPDKKLGIYSKTFANTLCLLEEREPLGNSDNTAKMYRKLDEDNDNNFDSTLYLKARLLDLMVGDWDRHEDQWRWVGVKDGKGKTYKAVPRDRDQVLYINEGLVPWIAARRWLLPFLEGYGSRIRHIEWVMWESRFLNARFLTQFTLEEVMQVTNSFVASMTDSVLEVSLTKMPAVAYNMRKDLWLKQMKQRRDNLPQAMKRLYYFLNKRVDIKVSDKNEWVDISDSPGNGLQVQIYKLGKSGDLKDRLFKKTFAPAVTKEIRIYLAAGNDSIRIRNTTTPIKLRIVGTGGNKNYNVAEGRGRIKVYAKESNVTFSGNTRRLKTTLSNDSINTAFEPVNLYNVLMPQAAVGFNVDDGLFLGAGFRYTRQEGFRKKPYASLQQLVVGHSFSTDAFNITYKGEWIHVVGKADIVLQGVVKAPNNTVNFFGRGNETEFIKAGNYKRYYRTRYNTYLFNAALRWRNQSGISIMAGPSVQHYSFDADDNKGRFINNTGLIHSYDSATVAESKWHAGAVINFTLDKRNNTILPAWGTYINVKLMGYKGLNNEARSYGQATGELALYKSLNRRSTLVLAERIGGGLSVGKTAFYQSLFLGGHENLLGYRQYRFAGEYSLYNNLELRLKIADIGSYVLPGQFGALGFFDIGRVWEKGERSDKLHNGVGGGIYFSPIQRAVIKVVAGYSAEGWYPYVTMGMRF